MRNSILSLVFLLLISTLSYAQQATPLRLQAVSLTADAAKALSHRARSAQSWEEYTFQGETFLIVQFADLPSKVERENWEEQGLRFIQYLPDQSYLVGLSGRLSPADLPFPILLPMLGTFKIARSCTTAINRSSGAVKIAVHPMPGYDARELLSELPAAFKPEKHQKGFLEGIVEVEAIPAIAAHPGVWLIEVAEQAPVPEGLQNGAVVGAPIMHNIAEGIFTGEQVVIGIADDGNVFHKDLKNRLIVDLSDDFGTSHGEMTTSIAAGAGNLLPEAQGLAPAAKVHLSFILDYLHHEAAVENYNQHRVTITSTSYGDGCGGFYSSKAAALDDQMHFFPVLMHCFSAGNGGGSTCSEVYGLIEFDQVMSFANLTGGRKAAKNGLTVGNVDTDGILAQSSSIGPAEDGRLKPDIVAVGQNAIANGPGNGYITASGTSASAPVIAGILARLTQAYRALFGNQDPPSALLKAALLNGARDIGRPGPDFQHGWGLADAGSALKMIQNQQFYSTKLSHGGERTFSLVVPEGASAVKVMAVWHDVAGAPIAEKALVNDLDLRVLGPEGQLYHPLVLSSYPHPDSLTANAKPGVDRLNNVEQVVIKDPAPGNYTIKLKGYLVPEGPQSAFIVYRFESAGLGIRHPVAQTAVAPGDQLKVVWDRADATGPLALAYRKVGSGGWTTIATNLSGHSWLYNWKVPAGLSGKYQVRLSTAQSSSVSAPFTILGKPGFFIQQTGIHKATMHWAPVEGAAAYEVFALGEQYMEPLGETSQTAFEFSIPQGSGNWFSIRAKTADGSAGPRAKAHFYRQSVCNNQAVLKLFLDDKPGETTWTLADETGQDLMIAGPYPDYLAGEILEIPICLPDGCFTLSVQDSGHDGLCCEDGEGKYELFNGQGHMLAEGSHFGGNGTAYFCMESNHPALQAFTTATESVSCNGATDGWAIAYPNGGTGTYTFNWSTGATTQQITGLPAGNYTVTISDQITSVTSGLVISEPAPLSAVIATEDSGCGTVNTGMASAMVSGGTAPYYYYWSTGDTGKELQQIPAGSYSVTVQDSKGCSVAATAQVLDASPLALYLAGDAPACADEENGAAFASVVGGYPPYQYEWSNGSNLSTATSLAPGNYQLTVTDVLGCTATGQIELASPPQIGANITYTDTLNHLEVSVFGGVPPYSFQWSNGSTASTMTISESEVYQLTITDANGCQRIFSEEVSSEAPEHCQPAVSNNAYNWIEAVQVDTMVRQTGQNATTYESFVDAAGMMIAVRAGQLCNVSLSAGFQGGTLPVFWRVWIDLNEDGDFEDQGERVFHSGQQNTAELSFLLQLPEALSPGLKVMRVSQSFLAPPDPCGVALYGETEDYLLRVVSPVEYCTSTGQSTSQEWIKGVQIGGLAYISGNDGGYGNHTHLSHTVSPGMSLPMTLTPGYGAAPMVEFWSVWADFNRDGIFNHDNELVYQSGPAVGPVSGMLEIPESTMPGPLLVRVQMRWNALLNPCGAFSWGEVEDYQLMLEQGNGLRSAGNGPSSLQNRVGEVAHQSGALKVWPVPAAGTLHCAFVQEEEGPVEAVLFDGLGRVVLRDLPESSRGIQQFRLSLHQVPTGLYQLQVRVGEKTMTQNIIKQ